MSPYEGAIYDLNMKEVIVVVSLLGCTCISVAGPGLQCLGSFHLLILKPFISVAISPFKDSGICQGSGNCLAELGFSVKRILSTSLHVLVKVWWTWEGKSS